MLFSTNKNQLCKEKNKATKTTVVLKWVPGVCELSFEKTLALILLTLNLIFLMSFLPTSICWG